MHCVIVCMSVWVQGHLHDHLFLCESVHVYVYLMYVYVCVHVYVYLCVSVCMEESLFESRW